MKTAAYFVCKPVRVRAIQWTGDNVEAIQAFVTPASPLYRPACGDPTDLLHYKPADLAVAVRDAIADSKWPTIEPNYKQVSVPIGAWLVIHEEKGAGDLCVLTQQTFLATYEPVGERERGMVEAAAREAWTGRSVAAFELGAPLKTTHPRAVPAVTPEIEPSAVDGVTVDKE